MDFKEKLDKAANDFARGYSFNDETLKDCSFYSYEAGARWLQSQPLADRLTEEEREKIIGFYKEAEELETYGATESDRKEGRAFIVVFHSIFGKEMFENNE